MPVLGIAGLVAFWRRTDSASTSAARPAVRRIAGDGTSKPLDMLALLVGISSALVGFNWYMRWGYRHGLEHASFVNWWLLFIVASLIATTAHELGHASIGIAVGMKVRMFQVGPFRWRIRDGRWRFDFVLAQIFKFGGATAVVPLNPRQERWRDNLMLAAGPAGSLFIGLVALGMMVTAPNSAYERYWEVFALIALFGLCSVLFNLVPQRPEALYTDGARIYQLLGGGPWSDLHRILAAVLATTVTPLRSRDLDIEQIRRTEAHFSSSVPGISLKLIASSYYMDTGDLATADRYVAEAEAIYQQQDLLKQITPEMCILLTYRVAVLRRDAAAARAWWERAAAQKIAHRGFDFWLAKSALGWIEGHLDDADQDWQQASQRANQSVSPAMRSSTGTVSANSASFLTHPGPRRLRLTPADSCHNLAHIESRDQAAPRRRTRKNLAGICGLIRRKRILETGWD